MGLLLVWSVYRLFLRDTTFHGLNRGFLMLGSVMAVAVPLIPVRSFGSKLFVGIELPVVVFQTGGIAPIANGHVDWILLLYGIGALAMLAFQLMAVFRVVKLLRTAVRSSVCGVRVFRSSDAGPFSFFNLIHIPFDCEGVDADVILRHEQLHVRQWHSLDVVWLGALRTVFWFNPLLVMLQRDLQTLHEYLADEQAFSVVGRDSYARLQMAQVFKVPTDLFPVNSFINPSNLKNRIAMMYKEKTAATAQVRYFVTLPLAAILLMVSACAQQPSEKEVIMVEESTSEVLQEAEKMPEYPGGFQALASELGAAIKYPSTAEQDNVEGTVFVQFVVSETGAVTNVEAKNSVHPELDAEALRVVNALKDWTPGQNDGKAVRVQMVLPIKFVLG